MPDDFTIADLSDFHLGSPNCAENKLIETIEQIKQTPNRYVVFKGDAIEAITPGDKRYVHSCVKDDLKSPKEQADRVIQMFRPIKDRILAWGIGNHEDKLTNTMAFGQYMAESIGCPYGAWNFKIIYTDSNGDLMFKTYHTHGRHGLHSNAKDDIQYDANRRAALKNMFVRLGHADCIYESRGHDHQLLVVDPTVQNKLYLTDNGKTVKQHYHQSCSQNAEYIPPDSRWYATTGSFRKLYTPSGTYAVDYGEIAGYSPSEIGYALVTVKGKKITGVEKVVC